MLERFRLLEENISELIDFRKNITLEKLAADKPSQWALRYGLMESIQIVIDISCHLVSQYNLGNPSTYGECIEFLGNSGYLSMSLAQRLVGMAGLRNLLVHEYVVIDNSRLYKLLDHLDDFRQFVEKTKQYFPATTA